MFREENVETFQILIVVTWSLKSQRPNVKRYPGKIASLLPVKNAKIFHDLFASKCPNKWLKKDAATFLDKFALKNLKNNVVLSPSRNVPRCWLISAERNARIFIGARFALNNVPIQLKYNAIRPT